MKKLVTHKVTKDDYVKYKALAEIFSEGNLSLLIRQLLNKKHYRTSKSEFKDELEKHEKRIRKEMQKVRS